jgi:DNA polymerase/3'-5' exonuclease PolX
MSFVTTTTMNAIRRPLEQAIADAEAFRALFPPASYLRWEIAGSIRRRAVTVADVDHIVEPAFGDVEVGGGLFAQTERVNLLWFHLDALTRGAEVRKHLYTIHRADGETSVTPRWGERLRGCDFRELKHEIWTADADNWGAQLAIRTGPGPFSQSLVVALQRQGYVNDGGYVQDKRRLTCPCGWAGAWGGLIFTDVPAAGVRAKWKNGNDVPAYCPGCGDGMRLEAARVPAPEEREYFRLCGMRWIRPEERR